MLVLKCDQCKKEVNRVIRFSIESVPYSIGDEKRKEQLKHEVSKTFEFCEDCFKNFEGCLSGKIEREMSYNERRLYEQWINNKVE